MGQHFVVDLQHNCTYWHPIIQLTLRNLFHLLTSNKLFIWGSSFARAEEEEEDDGGVDENGNKPCVGLCYLNKLQAMREGGDDGAGHPMEVGGNVPVVVFLSGGHSSSS